MPRLRSLPGVNRDTFLTGRSAEITIGRMEERRTSPRLPTRIHVRGLGADRQWSDRLGDVSLGGVGFEFPRAPEAEKFQIVFSLPDDARARRATAELIDYEPLEGTRDRDHPFFVRVRFARIELDDELAIARSLQR